MTRRRERRRKKLLDDLKDRRGYCQLKEEALDRPMWRNVLEEFLDLSFDRLLMMMMMMMMMIKLKLKDSILHQSKLHHISNPCYRPEQKKTSTGKRKLIFKYKDLCPTLVFGQGRQGIFRKKEKKTLD